MLSIFPSIHGNVNFSKLLDAYPEVLRKMFQVEDYTTGPGYLRAEVFSFVAPLLLTLFAVLWGSDLVAGEEERHHRPPARQPRLTSTCRSRKVARTHCWIGDSCRGPRHNSRRDRAPLFTSRRLVRSQRRGARLVAVRGRLRDPRPLPRRGHRPPGSRAWDHDDARPRVVPARDAFYSRLLASPSAQLLALAAHWALIP